MSLVFVVVQVFLLMVAIALLVTSLRTSLKRRSHHSGCLILAAAVSFLTLMFTLFSLANVDDESHIDDLLSFLPPGGDTGRVQRDRLARPQRAQPSAAGPSFVAVDPRRQPAVRLGLTLGRQKGHICPTG